MPALHLLVPGPLDRPSGGSRYDRRMAQELRALGWTVEVAELDGAFPDGDAVAQQALRTALAACADGARVLIDGLAGSALPELLAEHATRLRLLLLVHLPLAEAVALSDAQRAALLARECRALAQVRGAVVTSHYSAGCLQRYGVPASRIAVVQPGTDPASPARGSGDAALRLLCVAAVSAQKGHDVLVEALAGLRDQPWQLRCVGGLDAAPDFVAALRRRIDALDLGARVHFSGALDQAAVAAEYAAADLFVLPTRLDTYGMVLTEAAVRGLPILSTRSGGIAQTLPADAALLVPPGDVAALATALRRLLGDAALRERFRAAALRACFDSWPEAAQRLAAALQSLAAA